MLAALGFHAWAQGEGPVAPLTAPPGIQSATPPSVAVGVPRVPRVAPRPPGFAAAAAPGATRLTAEAREERRFLRTAAAQSKFELDASTLAFAKSGNAQVRALAAALINHHKTLGLELAHLLNSRGMAMPMASNEDRKVLNQLKKLSGSRFDAVYMQRIGLAQAAVARDYEKASAAIRDPQLNAWIVKTLANTRFHQNMAERAGPVDPQSGRSNRAAARARGSVDGAQPASPGVRQVSASSSP